MGSWGSGAFDSDNALDFLVALSQDVDAPIELDDDGCETPTGPGDLEKTRTYLGQVLEEALGVGAEPKPPWEMWDVESPYAAAGLVAAVLRPLHGRPDRNAGTRLLANRSLGDDGGLHLDAHCGYTALLTPELAAELRPAAHAAALALRENPRCRSSVAALDQLISLLGE